MIFLLEDVIRDEIQSLDEEELVPNTMYHGETSRSFITLPYMVISRNLLQEITENYKKFTGVFKNPIKSYGT